MRLPDRATAEEARIAAGYSDPQWECFIDITNDAAHKLRKKDHKLSRSTRLTDHTIETDSATYAKGADSVTPAKDAHDAAVESTLIVKIFLFA
ncbi:hypothetical protein COCVIDRAFT_43135 [Bipolaris victoriae FI3]|uniref:Uncharacterized protein n=1 Tax=Bipolaris victoriae (strain FI3) TaxID=930091 RepID=W7E417_BIPV3|nr:hypothetical protein COCVIDRAFT_43135 [Bipolaris victoriae FI3]